MRLYKLILSPLFFLAIISTFLTPRFSAAVDLQAGDPLPSWNDGPNKNAIVEFVSSITDERNPRFIPKEQRIATFDNDGTLWSEQPLYFQAIFIFDRITELAPSHPEWTRQEPFASVLSGDTEGALSGGEKALLTMVAATHAGLTVDEFSQSVAQWLANARHPSSGKPFTSMIFAPMLELLDYLRANSIKVFIVSGGGTDFIRVFAEEAYGIPPEQVIGSSLDAAYEIREGNPVLVKQPAIDLINDKAGKPVGIHRHIGRRPILAVGNSDGDFEMLEYTSAGKGSRLGIIVHHDDGEREWAYDRNSHIGHLSRGLDEGPARGWLIVSMKNDWNRVYP